MPSVRPLESTDEIVGGVHAGGQPDELGHLTSRQATDEEPDDSLGASDLDEHVRQLGGDIGLDVPVRRNEQHPDVRAGTYQVPYEQQRRRIGPMHVLEHEQHRPPPSGCREEVDHRAVESQPFRVGIHCLRYDAGSCAD